MKKNSVIGFVIAILTLAFSTTSCSDMLSPDMSGRANSSLFGQDTVYSYLGILKSMQNIAERQVILGEVRGDLATTTEYTTDSVGDIANFKKPADGSNGLLSRASYYNVINQCNIYLNNVDTSLVKNSVQYMKKEYAQVVTMRAWAYMQLVQVYGKVPFITQPVTNSNTGWEKNPPEGWATSANLLNLLEGGSGSLTKAYNIYLATGFPSYKTYKTGAVDIASSMCMFPPELVLADLYLLRGSSQQDFASAAQLYYNYLKTVGQSYSGRQAKYSQNISIHGVEKVYSYNPSTTNWIKPFNSYTKNSELLTIIPSAANSSLGTVMKSVQNIYGYATTSVQTTVATGTTTTSGVTTATSATTTGNISVSMSLKYRQVQPSNAYSLLNEVQTYAVKDPDHPTQTIYWNCGDARIGGSRYQSTSANSDFYAKPFISKFCPNNSFHYCIPVYRTSLVYLRFAEAINRAGFPEYAFAVLRNGLNSETMAKLADSVRVDSINKTKETVYYIDTVAAKDRMYASIGELRRAASMPWLDFSGEQWKETIGIHALGSGLLDDTDTMYTYQKMVAKKIADEKTRVAGLSASAARRYARRVMRQTLADSTLTDITAAPTQANAEEINAVEDLIVDELALETAFEGNRFFDLARIATHKNNNDALLSGFANPAGTSYGTSFGSGWLAWKVARRNLKLTTPYENPKEYDASIFSKLMVPENWYMPNPVY